MRNHYHEQPLPCNGTILPESYYIFVCIIFLINTILYDFTSGRNDDDYADAVLPKIVNTYSFKNSLC